MDAICSLQIKHIWMKPISLKSKHHYKAMHWIPPRIQTIAKYFPSNSCKTAKCSNVLHLSRFHKRSIVRPILTQKRASSILSCSRSASIVGSLSKNALTCLKIRVFIHSCTYVLSALALSSDLYISCHNIHECNFAEMHNLRLKRIFRGSYTG